MREGEGGRVSEGGGRREDIHLSSIPPFQELN